MKLFVWMLSARVIQILTGIISNLALARFLSPEDFGRYALVAAPLMIGYACFSFRLSSQILSCSESKFSSHLYLNAIIQEGILGALVFFIALGIFHAYSWLNVGILLDVTCGFVLNNLKAFHERKMSYKSLAREEMIGQLGALLIVLAIVYKNPNPLILCLKGLLTSSYLALRLVPRFSFQWLSLHHWKDLLQRCRGFWADTVLATGLLSLLQLVANFSGERIGGLFFQAHRIAAQPANWFAPSISRYALNILCKAESSAEKKRAFQSFLLFTLLPLLALTLFLGFWSHELLLISFGTRWIDAAPLLTKLSSLSLLMTVFQLFKVYFLSENHYKTLLWIRIVQCLPLVIFSLFMQDTQLLALALPFSYFMGISIGIYRFRVSVPHL